MAKLKVIKTVGIKKVRRTVHGKLSAGVSFDPSGCSFSSKTYRRGRLPYGIALVHSFDSNGHTGKFPKGNRTCEIPLELP
jgi:hypothetical protein